MNTIQQEAGGWAVVGWPANSPATSRTPPRARPSGSSIPAITLRPRTVVLLVLLFALSVAVTGVTGFFRLSSETAVLRQSAMDCLPGRVHKRLALHAGFFTTGLAHIASRFFKLPPEAVAGIQSVRSAEVGLYQIQGTGKPDIGTILARADAAMSARGWDRVVGVLNPGNQLVAVYMPGPGRFWSRMQCCVLVLKDSDLVVARAAGNLEPLLEIAQQHIHLERMTERLAMR